MILSSHQTEDVAALCRQVVVMHRGHARFHGSPRDVARVAAGHVWLAAGREEGARLSWRTGEGHYRHIGDPPPGARLVEPSIEDGYLLLVGDAGLDRAA